MIMRSEGQGQNCKSVADCDPNYCEEFYHVVCKNNICRCDHGAPIGGACHTVNDCYPSACPPNSHVHCDEVCLCQHN